MLLDLIETAISNGRRDEGKYTFTAPDEIFTDIWTLTRTTDTSRRYFVTLDEAGIPRRCSCPSAKRAEEMTGENICKHQYLLAEYLRTAAIRATSVLCEKERAALEQPRTLLQCHLGAPLRGAGDTQKNQFPGDFPVQKQTISHKEGTASNPFSSPSLKTTVSEAEYGLIGYLQSGNMPLMPYEDPEDLLIAKTDGMTSDEVEAERAQWRAAQKELCEQLREYIEQVSLI